MDRKISRKSFDRNGNLSFGIKEHIDIPGIKYSPKVGIIGMDITVAMERLGYRVKRRHRMKSKVGSGHLLVPDEAVIFMKNEFDVEII